MNNKCSHFPQCGGCSLLDKAYELQLSSKRELLCKLFAEWKVEIPEIIKSPQTCFYRHKVQLPFGFKKEGNKARLLLGCFGVNSHMIIDQNECLIQDKELSGTAWCIRKWAQKAGFTVYSEKSGNGFLRHVLLRKGAGTGEIIIGLVTNGERPEGSRNLSTMLLDMLKKDVPDAKIVGIVQNINTRDTNVVLGRAVNIWWGRPYIKELLGDYKFKVGLSTFFQVNPFQTPNLYNEVLKNIPENSRVLDLYCGVGSIAFWISSKASTVVGIEKNEESVAAGRAAVKLNKLNNVKFISSDASKALPELLHEGFDTVVVDPPRKGLDSPGINTFLAAPFKRIIYVSCDPQSLSRDVKLLNSRYRLISIQGVDMFPHTEHIESVAVLDSRES